MKHHFHFYTVVLLFSLSLPAHSTEAPRLIVEGPPALSSITVRLQQFDTSRIQSIMNLVGINHLREPIRVIVAPEQSDWAQPVPTWVSGYAISQQHLIVVLPERVVGYPYDSLESLFAHEIAHIVIGQAAGGQSVPRWFDEGLAMVAAHSWDIEDRARLAWAIMMGNPTTLNDLEQHFHQDRASAHEAYVLSHAFVRYGIQQFGDAWPKQLLASLKHGASFQEAFVRTTAQSLEHAQADFWDEQSLWTNWIPVFTSSVALWLGILGLAFYVFKKQRQRAEALQQEWKEEEH